VDLPTLADLVAAGALAVAVAGAVATIVVAGDAAETSSPVSSAKFVARRGTQLIAASRGLTPRTRDLHRRVHRRP
jgi:hypothetical protein